MSRAQETAPAGAPSARATIDVAQFQRRAGPTSFSVERLFDDVRGALPDDIRVRLRVNRHMSEGLLGRLQDAFSARRRRGTVNHVLGDVHYLAWFLPRRDTVLTVLDCVSLERLSGARRRLFWLLWYWWPARRAAHVTVISEFSAATLRRWLHIPPERLHVIHPPLSPEFQFSPSPPRGERARVLQVGTVDNKNLERVIPALAGLPVELVVVGRLSAAQQALLREHGVHAETHANLDRGALAEQYRRAHMLLFASTYEGFGLPIIEAQATGRPVVTSTAGAMPEAAGGAACLVDPFDIQDIRRGVERVLGDPEYADDLVRRGRENAASYRAERIAEEYAGLYRRVAAEAAAVRGGAPAASHVAAANDGAR
jgi:glycosyltransferase involved in cell wall biosynthesis